ncbi:MAG: DUF6502 family protein [Gammaproteobacteria bacterium]
MSNPIQQAALKACRHFMVPIARFLLRNGIGYREFAEISKLAFVQVASDEYGIRGRKTNMSRVAIMTGLTRKEVRKVRDRLSGRDWALDTSLSRPGVVLSHWAQDPEFLTKGGKPKALRFSEDRADRPSIERLVKKHAGDIPPGAMLKELERAECVTKDSRGRWKLIKREFSPGGTDTFLVQRFGECIHDLANTMSYNMSLAPGEPRLFEFRAWNDAVPPTALLPLREFVAKQGYDYLQAVDDLLGASETDPDASKEARRCGVGVYYFEGPRLNQFAQ